MIINPIFFTGSQDDEGIIDNVNIRNPWFGNPRTHDDVPDWESQNAEVDSDSSCLINTGGYIRQTVKISGGHTYWVKMCIKTEASRITLTVAFDAGAKITRPFTIYNTKNNYVDHYEHFAVPDNATEMTFTIEVSKDSHPASVDEIQCVRWDTVG